MSRLGDKLLKRSDEAWELASTGGNGLGYLTAKAFQEAAQMADEEERERAAH